MKRKVPNGGVTALEHDGHTGTGARDPRGGPVVTAGGLVFAATASDHKVRVWDEVGGREYIAFCVAGGDGLNLGGRRAAPDAASGASPPQGAYMVFALPKAR